VRQLVVALAISMRRGVRLDRVASSGGWTSGSRPPKDFHALQTNPTLTISQFKAVAAKYREVIPVYIKDYINLERFAA
jgi:hypothetical protein